MSRPLSVGLAFVLIIVAAGLFSWISGMKKPAERKIAERIVKQVKVTPVKNQTLQTELELTGRLVAKQKVEVFAEVGGTLLPNGNRFREGNYFKKGENLIRIDDEEPRLALLAQKSALMNQITLMLPDLKSDYESSFPDWEAYVNEMKLDEALVDFPEAKSEQERYFVSSRNLYNLFYSIKSAESRLGKYRIQAPFNGVVASSAITEGTLVRAGQKMGDFMNSYSYELEASVNETDIDLLRRGSKVELFADNGSESWKGTVSRISQVVDPATQTIKVFISTAGKGLKEGMYLNGRASGREIDRVIEIPRDLLIEQDNVFIIKDSLMDLVEIRPVHLTTRTAIVTGLSDGDMLVNETVSGAYEGLVVSPIIQP